MRAYIAPGSTRCWANAGTTVASRHTTGTTALRMFIESPTFPGITCSLKKLHRAYFYNYPCLVKRKSNYEYLDEQTGERRTIAKYGSLRTYLFGFQKCGS